MLPDYKLTERLDFFGTGLCMFCHNSRNKLAQIKRAYNVVNATWYSENEKISTQLAIAIEQVKDEDDQYCIGESFSEDFHEIYEFEVLHRHSMLLTIQNSLEHLLDELCQLVTYTMNSQIKHTDLKDSGITRALKYLDKVAGFDFSSIQRERQEINNAQQIRNLIVHAGGKLPDGENAKSVELVRKSEHFSGSPGNYLTIRAEFIDHYFDVILNLFEKLDHQVKEFMQRCKL